MDASATWVRRGFSNSRTRFRGPIFGMLFASLLPGWDQIPAPAGPAFGGAGWSRDFVPPLEAEFGPKMSPRRRVRLLLRPGRLEAEVGPKMEPHRATCTIHLRDFVFCMFFVKRVFPKPGCAISQILIRPRLALRICLRRTPGWEGVDSPPINSENRAPQ